MLLGLAFAAVAPARMNAPAAAMSIGRAIRSDFRLMVSSRSIVRLLPFCFAPPCVIEIRFSVSAKTVWK
jgi:hypothetical protein